MIDRTYSRIINALHKGKRSARCYINADFSSVFFEECIRTVTRQVVLDLYISEALILQIENHPFFLNKLFDLKIKGGNIYISDRKGTFNQYQFICQVDFSSTIALSEDEAINELHPSKGNEIFSSISPGSFEYRVNNSNIQVEFSSLNNSVIKGTNTTISWNVKNADSVWVDGLGEVPNSGKRNIQILDNTLLTLKAKNRDERKYKAIFLRAIKGVEINFDVLFFNPASKEYVSLKTEDTRDGVFGVSKGHKVKITWNVEHADMVEVQPFGITNKSSEYVFMPDGSSEITMRATHQGKATIQRIIIHQYPMPIFKENLVNIENAFNSTAKFSSRDFRSEAFSFLNEKKNQESLEALKAKIMEQEKRLVSKAHNLKFTDFYKDHSINRLNKDVMNRLMGYFNEKPEVIKMLHTLKPYKDVE